MVRADMRLRSGEEEVRWASHDPTVRDEKSGLRVLNPEARKLCRGRPGPAHEDGEYARYDEVNCRVPPADHQPPAPGQDAKPKPKRRGRLR